MPSRAHDIHHWQTLNPVTTEALIMLTLGAPQMLYNGGLLLAPLRYFDLEQRRPGLPKDVAALVSGVTQTELEVTLCNLSAVLPRSLVVQAGTLREHTFTSLTFTSLTSTYPGAENASFAMPFLQYQNEIILPRQAREGQTFHRENSNKDARPIGTTGDYAAPDVQEEMRTVTVDGASFAVELPPGTQILLTIGLLRNTSAPSYEFPF